MITFANNLFGCSVDTEPVCELFSPARHCKADAFLPASGEMSGSRRRKLPVFLLIFLPPLPFLVQIALKLAASAVTVSLAFGVRQRLWLWQWFCFFGCNFLLAGLLLAVCSRTEQGFAAWGNSYCYLIFPCSSSFYSRRWHIPSCKAMLFSKAAPAHPGSLRSLDSSARQNHCAPRSAGYREYADRSFYCGFCDCMLL